MLQEIFLLRSVGGRYGWSGLLRNSMRATLALALTLLLAGEAFGESPSQEHNLKSAQDASPSAAPIVPSESGAISTSASGLNPASSADSSPRPTPSLGYPFTPGPDYVIGLGDVLRISVWKEPEVSSTVQVRSDGKISVPLLNDVQAVGFKPMDLAASLSHQLQHYLADPHVTVIVSQAKPPVVYMVGQVGKNGPMPLTTNMTVLQALVTAGMTTFANTRKIYVLRPVNGVEQRFPVNYKRLVNGKSMNQNIVLKPGDMVVVP